MLEATSIIGYRIWEIGDGIVVKYSLGLLEDVRRLAVDGLTAFSHGGKETGGILYGTHEAGCITVLSFAELPCEHALGPQFLLSEKDRSLLAGLLRPPAQLEIVGWFRAHTRSGLELDAHDREMFNRYFAQAPSLALILKPTHSGPASAAFFVREPSGRMLPPEVREFAVEPLMLQAVRPVCAEDEQSTEREHDRAYGYEVPASPELTRRPTKLRRGRALALSAAAILGTVAVAIYEIRPARVELHAYAIVPGQVRIEWNHRPQEALDGASGVLEIQDGDSTTRLPLDAERIRSGTATYLQRTSHITVRFRSNGLRLGAAHTDDAIEFVGALAHPTPPGEIRRDPPSAIEAEVSYQPMPRAQVPQKQLQMRIETQPTLMLRGKAIRKAFLVTDASANSGAGPAVLPGPPEVEPDPPRPIGLPEFLSNPRHTSASLPPVSVKTAIYGGARSGRLIWTGVLGRRGVIEMDGAHVSVGSVTGTLPGVALSLRVSPAEFSRDGLIVYTADRARAGISEKPAKSNGWNSMHFKFDDGRARGLVVLEAPNRSNDFTRLVLRNEGRDCSVVVVDWSVQ